MVRLPKNPWSWHTVEECESKTKELVESAVCPVCRGKLSKSLGKSDPNAPFCNYDHGKCKGHLGRLNKQTLNDLQKQMRAARYLLKEVRSLRECIEADEAKWGPATEERDEAYMDLYRAFVELSSLVLARFSPDALDPQLRRKG